MRNLFVCFLCLAAAACSDESKHSDNAKQRNVIQPAEQHQATNTRPTEVWDRLTKFARKDAMQPLTIHKPSVFDAAPSTLDKIANYHALYNAKHEDLDAFISDYILEKELPNVPPPSAPVALPPDVVDLQSVFFATNRIIKTPKLQLASLTDGSITDGRNLTGMIFGVAVIGVPRLHIPGHVERPEKYFFGLLEERETDADHFRVRRLESLSREEFVNQLKGGADSLLLFVHGYRVDFADALFKAAQIAYDANFDGRVVVFSWPSAGALAKYDEDRESADFAVSGLLEVLTLIAGQTDKKKIFVVAHSMGNKILINALQRASDQKLKLNISELVMAAPDVEKDVFMEMADRIKAVAGNITMYASAADKALLASGIKSWGTRMGYIGKDGPNLVDGVETIDVTAAGDDMLGLNHSTYSENMIVLNDLGRIIVEEKHEIPGRRTPIFRYIPDRLHPKYWQYPGSH